jgi:hypothetical protein
MEFDPSRSDNKEQEGGFFEMNEDRLFSPKLPNNNICFEKYVPERNGVGYEWLGETIGAAN